MSDAGQKLLLAKESLPRRGSGGRHRDVNQFTGDQIGRHEQFDAVRAAARRIELITSVEDVRGQHARSPIRPRGPAPPPPSMTNETYLKNRGSADPAAHGNANGRRDCNGEVRGETLRVQLYRAYAS